MLRRVNKLRLCALLLGLVFLAAQLHFCSDLNSGLGSSHPCQICSTAGLAVTTQAVVLFTAAFTFRLQPGRRIAFRSAEDSRGTSPRAPPR
jgi:hypothetical protein